MEDSIFTYYLASTLMEAKRRGITKEQLVSFVDRLFEAEEKNSSNVIPFPDPATYKKGGK